MKSSFVARCFLLTASTVMAFRHASDSHKRWARLGTMSLALLGMGATLLNRIMLEDGSDAHPWLTMFALLDILRSTIPQLRFIGNLVSPVAVVTLVGYMWLGSESMRAAAGLNAGVITGWPLAWAVLCVVLSTIALVGWSTWWVKGNHGPIQEGLGSILTMTRLLPLAAFNAVREEIEFRMLLMGGLLHPDDTAMWWVAMVILLQALYFATLHVASGFPSGVSGGVLVFVWGTFLGILRYWTGGMALVLVLHFQADVVIFVLVLVEKRRRLSQ